MAAFLALRKSSGLLSAFCTIVAVMEAMITSFSAGIPAQPDNFIIYRGPPLTKCKKKPLAKADEPPSEFDKLLAQPRTPSDFPESGMHRNFSVDEEFNIDGRASSVAGAHHTTNEQQAVDYCGSGDSSGDSLANRSDTFVDIPDCTPDVSQVWESISNSATFQGREGNLQSSPLVPSPYPILDSPPIRSVPFATSSGTDQVESRQGGLGADHERKSECTRSAAVWPESNGSLAVCAETALLCTAVGHLSRTSRDALASIELKRDQPERACSVAKDDVPNANTNTPIRDAADRSDALPRPAAHIRLSSVSEDEQQMCVISRPARADGRCGKYTGFESSDDDIVPWIPSRRRRRRSTECTNDGMDNTATEQRRHKTPVRKPRHGRETRPKALLRAMARSAKVAQPHGSKGSLITSTPHTRRVKGSSYVTHAVTVSAQQDTLTPPPVSEREDQPTWAVDRIVSCVRKHDKVFYKVAWEPTWEPAESLQSSAAAAIAEFHTRHAD